MRDSKYRAKKVDSVYGVFDSTKEYNRFCELKRMQERGEIRELRRQVTYTLIPANTLPIPIKKGAVTRKTERACTYKADFVYKQGSLTIVEDVKGFKTKDYVIKRKLMLDRYGIQIKEI